jgi:NADPH:quinone reductase
VPRAVIADALGPPESYTLRDIAAKPLKRGQVRVGIKAAGISFVDVLTAAAAIRSSRRCRSFPAAKRRG